MSTEKSSSLDTLLKQTLDELAWASIQLAAWERIATSLHAVAQGHPGPSTLGCSFYAIQRKRDLYEECQACLVIIQEFDRNKERDNATG